MKAYNIPIVIVAAATVASCVDPPYQCPLHADGGCHSMTENYEISRHGTTVPSGEFMVPKTKHAGSTPTFAGAPDTLQETGETGRPVFKQPTVHRVWIAPYVDADGNLRSGEYTYFSTPGEWNYGTTRAEGVAGSSTFGPRKPTAEAVTAVPAEPHKATPAAPPDSTLPQPPAAASAARSLQSAKTNSSGITQPAVKLGE